MNRIIKIEIGDCQYDWNLFSNPFKLNRLETLANGTGVVFIDNVVLFEEFLNNQKLKAENHTLMNLTKWNTKW